MHSKIYLTLVNILFLFSASGQDKQVYKAMDKLANNNVDEALIMIYKFIQSEPLNPLGYFGKYKIQIKTAHSLSDYDSAYSDILKSAALYNNLKEKEKIKACEELGYCDNVLTTQKEEVVSNIFNYLSKTPFYLQMDYYKFENILNTYVNKYSESPFKNKALSIRDSLLYFKSIATKNASAVKSYIDSYPHSDYISIAEIKYHEFTYKNLLTKYDETKLLEYYHNFPKSIYRDSALTIAEQIGYKIAMQKNNLGAFQKYLEKYPNSARGEEIKNKIETIAYNKAIQTKNIKECEEFISSYPKSIHLAEIETLLEKLIFYEAKNLNDADKLQFFINRYPASTYKPEATILLLKYEFEEAKSTHSIDSLQKFMEKHPNSSYVKNAMELIEDISFKKVIKSADTAELNSFLKKYPNGQNTYEVRELIHKLTHTAYKYSVNDSFMMDSNRMYTASIYLKDPIVKKFFSSDKEALIDQLKRIRKNLSYNRDEERVVNYNSGEDFADYSNNLYGTMANANNDKSGEEDDENEENSGQLNNKTFTSYGYYFYSKSISAYGCECPRGRFDTDGSYSSVVNGNCVILKKDGKPIHIGTFKTINRTDITYVFLIENQEGKFSLFNTMTGNFICGFYDKIEAIKLQDYHYSPSSNIYSLLKIHYLVPGFKLSNKTPNINDKFTSTVINCKGNNLISNIVCSDPFSDNSSINYCFNKPLQHSTCGYLNGQYSSNRMLFENAKGMTGLCNATYDTLILAPIYKRIDAADEFGNIIITNATNQQFLYNIYSNSFCNIPPNYREIVRIHIPYGLYDSKFWLEQWANPFIEFLKEGSEYCRGGSNYLFKRPLIYHAKSTTGHAIINNKGKIIYQNPKSIEIQEFLDSFIIVRTGDKFDFILDLNGKAAWTPERNYKIQFLSPKDKLFLFGYMDENNIKHIGLYQIGNGKLTEAIYEKIVVENGIVYGYNLGKKNLLWRKL
jgi:hypothetical protein